MWYLNLEDVPHVTQLSGAVARQVETLYHSHDFAGSQLKELTDMSRDVQTPVQRFIHDLARVL